MKGAVYHLFSITRSSIIIVTNRVSFIHHKAWKYTYRNKPKIQMIPKMKFFATNPRTWESAVSRQEGNDKSNIYDGDFLRK